MIKIKPSPNADSRTATKNPTKDELLIASIQHIGDVQKACAFFAQEIINAGAIHDHTKINGIDDFFNSFSRELSNDAFKTDKWYQSHLTERHHINDRCPDDVTLIDLLEMIADITVGGMARSGSISVEPLNTEILDKAYKNTIKILAKNIEVTE
jgi:hypothetical protein